MEFTKKGQTLMTNGTPLNVGMQLPDFTVINQDNQSITKQDLITKTTLISVVPNINTPVCSISTKRFNDEVNHYPDVNFYTISTNTVSEQQTWCARSAVSNMMLLSDASHDFGQKMGLDIATAGIDARSVWVIAPDGNILYRQLVTELSHEPDYAAVLAFLRNKH
ncbi:MAG: thiol peroxidase [Candidatus Paralactobacillus gallistercoris]|uniref:Thiol peroxidase n=1 Tax=Candidatus Paralactobacillus gallistercoris TaxID=2838724 RepID=A0A948TJ05_9LACO|nr:thiol peroxidase [Candidatus Paralactobacillus gallistercoris]